MSESRRIKITKKCLKQALIELLQVNRKEKISITDICNLADVNRSTFYAHYYDINALMSEIENDVISQLPLTMQKVENDDEFLMSVVRLFEYIKNNVQVFRVIMFRSDNDEFTNKLTDYIYDYYKDSQGSNMDRYKLLYRISGAIGLVKYWIDDGFPMSPDEFAQFTIRLALKTK